jgi:hypothetical protein
MNINAQQHLSEKQVLQAIVDEMHLSAKTRRHLHQCPDCRHEMEETDKEFRQLGETARRLSPMPKRRPGLPVQTHEKMFRLPIPAVAVSFVLLLLIGWWVIPLNPPVDTGSQFIAHTDLWEDETLMSEISQLTDNALPEPYTALISESITETEYDYMEYLVPSADDEPVSRRTDKKGWHLT